MCLCVLSNKTKCKTVKRKQSYWKSSKIQRNHNLYIKNLIKSYIWNKSKAVSAEKYLKVHQRTYR